MNTLVTILLILTAPMWVIAIIAALISVWSFVLVVFICGIKWIVDKVLT